MTETAAVGKIYVSGLTIFQNFFFYFIFWVVRFLCLFSLRFIIFLFFFLWPAIEYFGPDGGALAGPFQVG